ncbi:MAG: BamA/TamA family outer membrane protein, partial [Rubripirellula sp.]
QYGAPQYGVPGPNISPNSDYISPQANSLGGTGMVDPYAPVLPYGSIGQAVQGPRVREADLVINGFPARTGRIMLGGAVNSDAGVTGQITIDERNFDITRFPRSFQDLFSGTAFRGAGQTFRIEAAPGSQFKRYTAQFVDPNLFGYLPISLSVSGFWYDRQFNDWNEERLGGRLALGYRVTPDLSLTVGVTGQNVDLQTNRSGPAQLTDVIGDNALYSGEFSLTHDTRNSPIQASRGHYFQFKFEESFGDFDYSRFETEFRQYWLVRERADGSGKQTVSFSTRFGYSGDDTPIFENFFAGGYATMRGFDFRGAGPVDPVNGVELGGRFQWLNTVEYMFPITADDAFRGVTFVDFGTVEEELKIDSDSFRVAPGVGLRVAIPMLGPAPLAFDFAFPVAKADTDDERMFSFYMSLIR